MAEKGDGGDCGVGGWFSCCWMWSSALPWELWPFLPPILDAGDLCGVLVLFHPCSSTWYLPLAPPNMGSSGFWGAPTLCFLGEGGGNASSASTVQHCHDNEAGGCLDAGSAGPPASLCSSQGSWVLLATTSLRAEEVAQLSRSSWVSSWCAS